MEKNKKKLTDKEEAFCQAYVNDPETRWNKTQSAIKAGYSENRAKEIGYQNCTKLHIKERINELCAEARETNGELITQVVEEYKKLAMKEEADKIKVAGLKGLAQYLGMDKQNIDITTGGEKLPVKIVIEGVENE
ncbi:MAG: terminase small subunit [Ignavibacteria bacterium]|jgi:phage terminase small subunit